jgi:hypothetical protein
MGKLYFFQREKNAEALVSYNSSIFLKINPLHSKEKLLKSQKWQNFDKVQELFRDCLIQKTLFKKNTNMHLLCNVSCTIHVEIISSKIQLLLLKHNQLF